MKTNNLKTGRREFLKKGAGIAAGFSLLSTELISTAALAAPGERTAAAPGKTKVALVGTGMRGTLAWGKGLLEQLPDEVEIDPEGWILKELLYVEEFVINGSVIEAEGSAPVADAAVYFGRIDDNYVTVFVDSVFTDENGMFEAPVVGGIWGLAAVKDEYLPSETQFVEVISPVTVLQFVLNAPAITVSPDSFFTFLDEGETYSDTFNITNTGVGPLIYSIAPTANNYKPPSKTAKINLSPLLKKPDLHLQNFKSLAKKTTITAPVDSLWQLVYADPIDNENGAIDLNETWLQIHNNLLFIKITSFHTFSDPTDFEYVLIMDSDGNRNTGLPTPYLGGDHLIAVSDYGTVYGVLLGFRNEVFEVIGFASYEDVGKNRKEFVVGFPLNLINPSEITAMFSVVQNRTNPLFDLDYAPNDNQGYFVYRAEPHSWFNINTNFGTLNTTETLVNHFSITPNNMTAGRHEFKILIANNQPGSEPSLIPIIFDYITRVEQNKSLIPKDFLISQNYPNPFNSETLIQYSLPEQGQVSLEIYNLLGQKIKKLVDKSQTPGSYSIKWDGSDDTGEMVGSGIYLYLINLNNQNLPARKMIILK